MKFSPAIQTLVDKAERSTRTPAKTRTQRGRRKTAAAVVAAAGWSESAGARERRKARESRGRDKTRLELLRYKLKKAKEATRAEIRALRARAKDSRGRLREQIKRFRARWRAWVNEQVAKFRAKHRAVWRGRIDKARLDVARAESELQAELAMREMLRNQARAARASKPRSNGSARRRGAVRAQESDQEVEDNLSPEQAAVWRKYRRRIKTRVPFKTRTEAFLEWLHDHPDALDEARRELELELEEGYASDYERYAREQYEAGGYQ